MSFLIRPAQPADLGDLHRLATSLSAQGFLTLPAGTKEMKSLLALSRDSFQGRLQDPDQGQYLFVLVDQVRGKAVGTSLIVARHGTPESPHLFFEVNSERRTLQLKGETEGRTELGGLILDPAYRGRPEKLGKSLSYVRFLYIRQNPSRFRRMILAELLPPFTRDGRSPLWECLGRKWTGLSYREANRRCEMDKRFFLSQFPREEILITSLSAEAQATLGKPGPQTASVARILEEAGFRYLNQIDPFDGGPHFGALQREIVTPVALPVRCDVPS